MMDNHRDNIINISKDDFVLVQKDTKILDKALESKPTTFLKDALKRFRKNKSSVVGAIILGILILLALIVPAVSTKNIDRTSKAEAFLAPKLFEAGTGFWDGTKKYTRIVYDTVNQVPADYYKPAVLNLKVDENPTYIDQASKNGKGGFVMFANETKAIDKPVLLSSYPTVFTSSGNYKVQFLLDSEDNVQESMLGEYAVYITYTEDGTTKRILLKEQSKEYGMIELDISSALQQENIPEVKGSISFELNSKENENTYILIKECVFSSNQQVENYDELVNQISFTDATKMVLLARDEFQNVPVGYWSCSGRKGVHNSEIYYCDFLYDTYAVAYDAQEVTYAASDLQAYIDQGLCEYDYTIGPESFKKLSDDCPIDSIIDQQINSITKKLLSVRANSYRYRKLGYKKMPKFILGTNQNGQDLFKKSFAGLRTSLMLGVCTAAFCFLFGLCWGAISGYFGGNIDISMERFCDILGGVPWIVIMTLAILHFGNNFITFFLALCLTGWMGTAARTRTQFYRFKGREYVLASRTLGASDGRLIFKHILPNSLGTIVTASVLMIPSTIFSEATLAYLNLGLQGVQAFGVMMSENQQYLQSSPNLVVFPAIIIALIMISFNLFGNGLRDALNPSLKGSE
ncbi:MAG: ABC transporter permease [Prevotella sp.]|nr:ABC transporter permease [Staphylococcus sp.]MCM1350942.1 ABC transporter permease [Prevotella sp.]